MDRHTCEGSLTVRNKSLFETIKNCSITLTFMQILMSVLTGMEVAIITVTILMVVTIALAMTAIV